MTRSSAVSHFAILQSPRNRLPGTELPEVYLTHGRFEQLSHISPSKLSINSTFHAGHFKIRTSGAFENLKRICIEISLK